MTFGRALTAVVTVATPDSTLVAAEVFVSTASVRPKHPRKVGVTRFIVLRHCEKAAGEDPNLTSRGKTRAAALAAVLASDQIDAVYSTPFKRTQETVQPLASARKLPVLVVEERDEKKLVAKLIRDHKGKSVVLASHVNVIPDLMTTMGVKEPLRMDENDYGDMFIVDIDTAGKATLTKERFGE
ncbi:MAG: histidine phosphatase family protein [Clostridia bacterium]|nr:histidine phosphatase family protein [Deltaproteobacteria bacterium]